MARDESNQTNTIVGPNTMVQGNLDIKGSLLVYGTVLGDVRSDGLIRTAKDSFIKGSVIAKEAVFDGELDGSLKTKGRTTLGTTAKMVGELRVGLLVIEEGAQFSGKCYMEGAKITAQDKRGDGSLLKLGGHTRGERAEAEAAS